ncbi:MAG: hypothetical protein A4S09_16840 [Proteobacteria bacterium SG_bin7]|nr:MAG: hypothetical protein A4S09_16840 [Proteobacteria bacterium SG_bin7]
MGSVLLALLAVVCMWGCSEQLFYLPSEQQVFHQNRSSINRVLDVLWVIDNSGSMETSQANLATNLDSFIDGFIKRNLSFKMAFTTSDAYMSLFSGNWADSNFRDGGAVNGHSGTPIITNMTPNIQDVFLKNARPGVDGKGDERVFQSIQQTLINPNNKNFLRPESFFAVIIISDEDDFSWDGSTDISPNYSNPGLHPVSRYVNFLDTFTGSVPDNRRYNVSTISIMDTACLNILKPTTNPSQKIGLRYMELADATAGHKGSLCANFAETLNKISGKLLELLTQFPLNRTPDLATIKVFVDAKEVPESATDGWTYNSSQNSIYFHGNAVPAEGQSVVINYNPATPR